MDFARRRKPGHDPRGKGAGQKKRDRLADSCAQRSQLRCRRGNHPCRVCMVPTTEVMLRLQGCHTGVPKCKIPGDLGSTCTFRGSPESPLSSPRAIYPSHQLQKREHPKGGAHEAQVRSQRRHRRSHALCGAAGPRAHFRRELRHGDREPTTLRPRSRRCSGAATAAPAAGAAWDPRTEPTGARNPAPPRQRLRPSRRPRPLTQGSPVLLWVEIIKKSSDRSTETEAASLSLMSLVCWTLSRSL